MHCHQPSIKHHHVNCSCLHNLPIFAPGLTATTYFVLNLGIKEQDDTTRTLVMGSMLFLSLVASECLQLLSSERRRQKFGILTRLGSLSCPGEDAFLWACQENSPYLLKYCSTLQIEKTDPVNLNGLHLACKEGMVCSQKSLFRVIQYEEV